MSENLEDKKEQIKEMLQEVFTKAIDGIQGVGKLHGVEFPQLEYGVIVDGKIVKIYYEILGEV